ncbi:hypothetical protein ACRAWD_03265 [Caulobacter segnis]
MKFRLLALWRGLPVPVRRAAHLTAGAPGRSVPGDGRSRRSGGQGPG